MTDRAEPVPAQIFYSYAHADEALRNELEKHLSLLQRQGLIVPWHDRDIQAGSEWKQEIDFHMDTASLILLLISPDFLASNYCYDYEMQRAMERHRRREARVIPVIMRPCDWQTAPFGALQALPRNGRPITIWDNQDQAFLEIEQSLRALIEQPQRSHHVPLSTAVTSKHREAMLLRLQQMYQGLMSESLQETAWIELGLARLPGAVENPTNLVLRRRTQPPQALSPDTSVYQVYQEANHELLILGAPGTGKSTLLYQLGSDLMTLASQQPTEPFPVLFPLSSWAQKRQPLGEWMVEQLASPLYHVPDKLGQQWVQDEQILPLLDGLDEMDEAARPACIAAINTYRREYPLCPLVVCSRSDEYQAATIGGRLHLQNAIEVQPLTSQQLDAALAQAGSPVAALRSELETNTELHDLARTPLWLNVLLLTFKDTNILALPQQRAALQQQVCVRFVQRMIDEKGDRKRSVEQTTHWLTSLARQMRKRNLTEFSILYLRPDWLAILPRMGYSWSVGLCSGLYFVMLGFLDPGLQSLVPGLQGFLVPGLLGLLGLLFGLLISQTSSPLYLLFFITPRRGSLVTGLLVGLLSGLRSGLLIGLLVGLLVSLFYSLLNIAEYYLLRVFLWRSGVLPFRDIAFCEDARARHLLRRIEGTYQFVHRLLLDYFADLDSVR